MNETKKKILDVSKKLFTEKDIDKVTVREIAEKSGISHTAIYLYFQSKHALILEVAVEPLEELFEMLSEIYRSKISNEEKLLSVCNEYISFGLEQKSIYNLISMYEGERVDLKKYDSSISVLRMKSLTILRNIIFDLLPQNINNEEQKINIVRGTFFFLHGVVITYMEVKEDLNKRIEKIVRDYLDYTIISTNH